MILNASLQNRNDSDKQIDKVNAITCNGLNIEKFFQAVSLAVIGLWLIGV